MNLANPIDSKPAQRARDEIAEAWDHLVSAAEHGKKQVTKGSSQARDSAMERAALAALALRGERPPSRWRWLALGLAAGAAAGVVAGALLGRRETIPGTDLTPDDVAREGQAAFDHARDRANSTARNAAANAKEAADKVRDKVRHGDDAGK